MSDVCVNYGGGVNSTAVLALLCSDKLHYKDPLIIFADTGAEYPQTYDYIKYIQPLLESHGHELITVKSKEGSLYDYCKNKKILPMRRLRWCTDRWKRKPLDDYRGKKEYKLVIGIDYGERHRAYRWLNDKDALFPLIYFGMNRVECIKIIEDVGWRVPTKSACWFCPYEKMSKFKELKQDNRELFDELCVMEQETLDRLEKTKMNGWFDQKRPLNEAVDYRYPEVVDGQESMCLYCMG